MALIQEATVSSIIRPIGQGASGALFGVADVAGAQPTGVVLKVATSRNRVGLEGLLNEAVGTIAARYASVRCPQPYWISDLSDEIHGAIRSHHEDISERTLAGFQFEKGLMPFLDAELEDPKLSDEGALLCLIDFLIMNADRTRSNHNAGYLDGVFAYDFGAAMPASGTSPSSFSRLNWGFDPSPHLFFHFGDDIDWMNVLETLRQAFGQCAERDVLWLMDRVDERGKNHLVMLKTYLEYLVESIDELIGRYRSSVSQEAYL